MHTVTEGTVNLTCRSSSLMLCMVGSTPLGASATCDINSVFSNDSDSSFTALASDDRTLILTVDVEERDRRTI